MTARRPFFSLAMLATGAALLVAVSLLSSAGAVAAPLQRPLRVLVYSAVYSFRHESVEPFAKRVGAHVVRHADRGPIHGRLPGD